MFRKVVAKHILTSTSSMNTSSYLHVLDGRIRIKVPEIKGLPSKASALEEALQRIPGVTEVKANPVTGNILILFESGTTGHEQILETIKKHGYLRGSHHSPPPTAYQTELGDKLTKIVVETLLEAAVRRVIVALI